jgi:hypothetical protein
VIDGVERRWLERSAVEQSMFRESLADDNYVLGQLAEWLIRDHMLAALIRKVFPDALASDTELRKARVRQMVEIAEETWKRKAQAKPPLDSRARRPKEVSSKAT